MNLTNWRRQIPMKKEFSTWLRGCYSVTLHTRRALYPSGVPRYGAKVNMADEKGVLGLSTIRRNRGISLEQIAQSTKISVRSLEAIEQGEFGKLPGGIYNTSYIKQYARAIDYDESALLAAYHSEMARLTPAPADKKPGKDKDTYGGGYRTVSGILGL